MKRIAFLCSVLVVLFNMWATPVNAEVPALPHAFYGTVEIDGSPAPVGTQVEARGEGVILGLEGNPIVTTELGKYGGEGPLAPKLIVQGDITDGTTLIFYVNGVAAVPTEECHSGKVTELNLTVIAGAPSLTVTTDQAIDIGTTTATLQGSLTDLGSASSVDVSFEWGTTTSYGNETAVQATTSTGTFSYTISGLASNTAYHFRAKAVDSTTSYGGNSTFITGTTAITGGGGGRVVDVTAPRISDITVTEITETSALISWKTHEACNSQVEYWASVHIFTPIDTRMVMDHQVRLSDLIASNTYYFKVQSSDAAHNTAISDEHTFASLQAPVAAFTITNLAITPSDAAINETVTINTLVTNTGSAAGSYTVTLKVNDALEASEEATLDAGASKRVTFTCVRDVTGICLVDVNGLQGSFTVKEVATETPTQEAATQQEAALLPPLPPAAEPAPEGAPPAATINWYVLGGIIVVVTVIISLIIATLLRRRVY